jgi:phosphohistidine phosphatase
MLTLMLLRHAKAVPQSGGDDFTRSLTAKGHEDATALGDFLREKGLIPDRALVSPSARTRETMEDLTRSLRREVPTVFEKSLYNATDGLLRDHVEDEPAQTRTLLVVGHNPGVLDLAAALASDGDPREILAMRSRFPPCSLAVITFDRDDWSDASASGGRLDAYVTAEMLAAD